MAKTRNKTKTPTADSKRVAAAMAGAMQTAPDKAGQIRRLHGPLNGREALYALTGFLTSREVPLTLSSRHTCANVAVLVDEFADRQGLPAMREHWSDLAVPVPEDDPLHTLTNEPHHSGVIKPPKTAEEVLAAFYPDLLELRPEEQNALLARVIQRLRENRKSMREQLAHTVDDLQHRRGRLHEAEDELQTILSGHFTIVQP